MPADGGLGQLAHVKVLDLSRMYPGAFCTLLLADLGADVVKVEAPGAGDGMRRMAAPGALFLVSDDAPTKTILGAGAGVFAVARMEESAGVFLPVDRRSPEDIAERWAEISDMSAASVTESAFDQTGRYVQIAINDLAAKESVR